MFTKSVTVLFAVSKMGVVLIKHRSEIQWAVLLGYLTISTALCWFGAVSEWVTRIDPLRFQTRCRRRQLNLALVFVYFAL